MTHKRVATIQVRKRGRCERKKAFKEIKKKERKKERNSDQKLVNFLSKKKVED